MSNARRRASAATSCCPSPSFERERVSELAGEVGKESGSRASAADTDIAGEAMPSIGPKSGDRIAASRRVWYTVGRVAFGGHDILILRVETVADALPGNMRGERNCLDGCSESVGE
jgi:hypothetical protein